jgi:hypothetical protein
MASGTSLSEFNTETEKVSLFWPNRFVGDMIAQISLKEYF